MAGSQAVSIKIVSFRGIESEFILSQNGDYDIGRSDTCFASVNAELLSRQHLVIRYLDGRVFVTDNNSSNGSIIGDLKLVGGQPYEVQLPSTILLANGSIHVELRSSTLASTTSHANSSAPQVSPTTSQPQLGPVTHNGSENNELHQLLLTRGQVLIGRSFDCNYVIDSLQASRKHALLMLADGQITLKDLDTTNGTFVNGEKISGSVSISTTDEITIGTTTFAIESGRVELEYAIVMPEGSQ